MFKVRKLLRANAGIVAYTGVEISKDHLLAASASIARDFPRLEVRAVCADYTRPYTVPATTRYPKAKKVGFFPGSTIGNFTPAEAQRFLSQQAALLGSGNDFIIGADLKKDPAILDAAYDDSAGVTAAFNLNLLVRINRELGGNFDLSHFRHRGRYNPEMGRVEMHLVSDRDQTVSISGRSFEFSEGESIHTENSYKYTIEEFQRLAEESGFGCVDVWTDPDRLFSIHYLRID